MKIEEEYPADPALSERMHRMFYPGTVALIGASHDPRKWGHRVLHSLLSAGFEGRCIPVNPKGGTILGLPVARSIAMVEGSVDLALVAVPAPVVQAAIEACVEAEVGAIFVITAGFSEGDSSGIGRRAEARMRQTVHRAQIPLGGPNGQGLTCTQARLCAQMYPIMPPRGGISLVTQSGNVGVSMSHMAVYYNIGLSKTISAGNEAALTTAQYLDFLAEDPDTSVVALYLEGADDGRHLLAALRRTSRRKPVVMLKSGRSDAGARAAVSHTGSLAGSDRVYDAAFRQAGVVRVSNLEELFDTAAGFATLPLPRGDRIGIITLGGGWGVLASDAAAAEGLVLPVLPTHVRAALDEMLPARWSKANPIDFVAAEESDTLIRTLDLLVDSGAFDSIVLLGPGHSSLAAHCVADSRLGKDPMIQAGVALLQQEDEEKMRTILERCDRSDRPIVLASDAALSGQVIHNPAMAMARAAGTYVFTSPERAMRVIRHLRVYAAWRERND
ncbi:MAG: CoA-binding protein [Deltaproteobacteria bacterium]|nr:CoA-binding protein [Deltaproteobacteria bacterium]